MAGFAGLSLTRGASQLDTMRRKLVVVIAAIVLGGGIWSMHFVAMLGLRLPILFFYDGLVTLVSALIAILMVGLALLILHFLPRRPVTLTVSGAIVGLGITVMHYVGMLGMELCRPQFAPFGVVVALIAALGLSILAIWVAYGARTKGNILLGTVCFGLSVFAVHFIAMAGTEFLAREGADVAGPALSNEIMAIGVTLSAFAISGSFLLSGVSFILPAATPPIEEPSETAPPAPDAQRPVNVPYEKDGRTQFVEQAQIVALRAEGHYSIVYSASEKLFCPWSISEAETRLADGFLRTHRSYLVNPSFVTGFERSKDNGACFFDGVTSLTKVPVSRSRLADVRAALGI